MTPIELRKYLSQLISHELPLSVMIWGAPGIGKSSVVAQAAHEHDFAFIDLRLSQLAPTDLRGLPVPENGLARWYPPEFLPRSGKGVLFLDELNMAPPAMQGIAQQLILDRRVGMYVVPDGWFIWAAGNRKEDRASVFDMPSPLANRFLHLEVMPDFDSFKTYAIERQLHEQLIAFLSFRPALLHKLDPVRPAWPSPRSWEMASKLHSRGMPIEPAVGDPTGEEFRAFLSIYDKLNSIDDILAARGQPPPFPDEPSMRYAMTVGLSLRIRTVEHALSGFRWLSSRAGAEWVQLFVSNMMVQLNSLNLRGVFVLACKEDKKLWDFVKEVSNLPYAGQR